jgi:uncharacterized protein (DUF1501 family)
MKRRQFLQSSIGLSALGLGGFSMLGHASSSNSNRKVLTIYNKGGWDTAMLFDPHPDSDSIEVPQNTTEENFGAIRIASSPEMSTVSEFFQQHSNKVAIVNGVTVGSISHTKCEQMFFTGSRKSNAPDYSSIIAKHQGTTQPLPYVILSGPRITGDLGSLVTNVDSVFSEIILPRDPVHQIPHQEISDFLFSESQDSEQLLVQEYNSSLERRVALNNWADLFEINGDLNPEQQLKMVMQLFAEDITQSALVQIDPPPFHYWDTHNGNDPIQSGCYNHLFGHLNRLIELLSTTSDSSGNSLLETTTVLVISEMGRMPVYNISNGKDHWPYTSLMLFGAGVRSGEVFGRTDDTLISTEVSMETGEASENGTILTAENLIAGLLQSIGIDPVEYLDEVEPFSACFSD